MLSRKLHALAGVASIFASIYAPSLSATANTEKSDNKNNPEYFLLSVADGHYTIDMTGHESLEKESIEILLRLKAGKKGILNQQELAKSDYPLLFQGKKTILIRGITPSGPIEFEVEKMAIEEGCSNARLTATGGKATAKQGGLAIVDGSFPKTAFVQEITAKKISETPLANAKNQIWEAVTKDLSKSSRDILASANVTANNLQLVAGRFGGEAKWLIWISASLPEVKEPSGYIAEQDFRFAGLFDEKGQLKETLAKAVHGRIDTIGGWEPQMLADVNGDGFLEIIASPSYYEGSSTVLYQWRNGKRFTSVIYAAGC